MKTTFKDPPNLTFYLRSKVKTRETNSSKVTQQVVTETQIRSQVCLKGKDAFPTFTHPPPPPPPPPDTHKDKFHLAGGARTFNTHSMLSTELGQRRQAGCVS